MTIEEMKALSPGDVVYVDMGAGGYDGNALINGREHRVRTMMIAKVNAKSVATTDGSYRPEYLLSLAAGDAAKAAFVAAREKAADVERRRKAAVAKVGTLFPDASFFGGAVQIRTPTIESVEELADLLVAAGRARQLVADIGRGLGAQADGMPAVVLTLTIAQAERVLAALR